MKTPNLKKKIKITLPKVQLLKSEKHFSLVSLLIFVLAFAVIGYFIYRSFAAGPVVATVQAENMSLPAGASVISDSSASGGQAVKLTANGTNTATISLPSQATSLSITARADTCAGSPILSAMVDGNTIFANTSVGSGSYANYSSTTLNLAAGSHSLSVIGSNLGPVYKGKSTNAKCYRNLYLDVTTFYGPNSSPPTVSLSASPATITSGTASTLSWNSANAASCTGSFTTSSATSGTASVSPTTTTTYSITCSGSGGSASAAMTVSVNATTSAGYPASYFSGPLGQNEVLPKDPSGAFLAVYPGATGSTNTDIINRLQFLQQSAGRKIDVIGMGSGGGGTYGGQTQCAYFSSTLIDPVITFAHSNGSVPLVSWTPNRWVNNSDSTLKQIIRGDRDPCIDAVAAHLKSFGYRIMIRPLHEYNFYNYNRTAAWTNSNPVYDYAPGGGTGPTVDPQLGGQAVAQAFQHIVNRFEADGAKNVGFVWCPDEGGYSRVMDGYAYPGNSYVDWVSVDRYNASNPTGWSSPLHAGWAEAWELWNYKINDTPNYHDRFAVANGKPFFISETSSKYDSSNINRKGNWYANIAKAKNPTDSTHYMSNLIGVDIFDQYVANEGPKGNNDWRIDSNQTYDMLQSGTLGSFSQESLNGWVTWAKDPHWNVGILGGAN